MRVEMRPCPRVCFFNFSGISSSTRQTYPHKCGYAQISVHTGLYAEKRKHTEIFRFGPHIPGNTPPCLRACRLWRTYTARGGVLDIAWIILFWCGNQTLGSEFRSLKADGITSVAVDVRGGTLLQIVARTIVYVHTRRERCVPHGYLSTSVHSALMSKPCTFRGSVR